MNCNDDSRKCFINHEGANTKFFFRFKHESSIVVSATYSTTARATFFAALVTLQITRGEWCGTNNVLLRPRISASSSLKIKRLLL